MQRGYSYTDLQSFIATMYENQPFFMRPFAYPVEFLNLAGSTTATQVLNIQADSDFTLTEIGVQAFNAGLTVGIAALASMIIIDNGSQERYSNDFVPISIYGSEGFSSIENNILSFPRFIQGNTSLSIQMRNDQGITTYSIIVSLVGIKSKRY